MRRAPKIDRNQPSIVSGLRKVGASVQHLAGVGSGCPDLLVGFRGINFALEVKDPNQPPNKRKLTPDQADFFATWKGQANVVETLEQAFAAIGVSHE